MWYFIKLKSAFIWIPTVLNTHLLYRNDLRIWKTLVHDRVKQISGFSERERERERERAPDLIDNRAQFWGRSQKAVYSGDPKTDHSEYGINWKPEFLKFIFLNRWLSGFWMPFKNLSISNPTYFWLFRNQISPIFISYCIPLPEFYRIWKPEWGPEYKFETCL